jgi:hypothetical protein
MKCVNCSPSSFPPRDRLIHDRHFDICILAELSECRAVLDGVDITNDCYGVVLSESEFADGEALCFARNSDGNFYPCGCFGTTSTTTTYPSVSVATVVRRGRLHLYTGDNQRIRNHADFLRWFPAAIGRLGLAAHKKD